MTTTTFHVRKGQLGETRLITLEDAPLSDGEVRVRVESFALTSNNITYAAFGEAMGYWQFYPTGEEGWGIVPVWGFGSVVQSAHPDVALGERLYGFWPMASSAVLRPERLSAAGFSDGTEHRKRLHAAYNQYLRCRADPFYTPDSEDLQALLRPLFATSFMIDDFLTENDFFGAKLVLLSSASSKVAYGVAFRLMQRPGIDVVGLTSDGNRAFCESLGSYPRVLSYEELDRIPSDTACVYTDCSGNAKLRRQIHTRFANLRYSCAVGASHVTQLGGADDLPGPRAAQFFMPAQLKKRQDDWGPAELGRRLTEAWHHFRAKVAHAAAPWLVVQRHEGEKAAQAAYQQVLAGRGDPRQGHILSLA
jgi:hypothetical protein